MKGLEWNEIVKSVMEQKGISQKELAEKSGLAKSSVCRYLSGSRKPRIDVLKNFADALSIDVNLLIEDNENLSPFDSIKLSIARHGSELTIEEQEELAELILGKKD